MDHKGNVITRPTLHHWVVKKISDALCFAIALLIAVVIMLAVGVLVIGVLVGMMISSVLEPGSVVVTYRNRGNKKDKYL